MFAPDANALLDTGSSWFGRVEEADDVSFDFAVTDTVAECLTALFSSGLVSEHRRIVTAAHERKEGLVAQQSSCFHSRSRHEFKKVQLYMTVAQTYQMLALALRPSSLARFVWEL